MKNKHSIFLLFSLILCLFVCLSFSVSAETAEKPVIILDPGHGGIDGGTNLGIRNEKTYNLIISQYLREELLAHGGFEVILTREDDDLFQKFYPRAIYIVKHDADLLLSIHCNSSTYDYVNGMEAFVSLIDRYAAYDLSNLLLSKVCEVTGMRNRGIFTREDTGDSLGVYYWDSEKNWDMPGASHLGKVSDYFSILSWASKFGTPSLILEHGYLSNSSDRALMDQDEVLRSIAKAEAEALIEYYYGHTHVFPAEKTVDFPSSCTMTGTKSYRCTVCGLKSETEALPADTDAHFWRLTSSAAATCTADGYREYVCQISHNLSASGHGNDVHTYTEILPKEEHSYRLLSETDGIRTEVCEICGEESLTVLSCETHTYEKEEEISPSCTENGSITYVCTKCKDSYTEERPALGHTTDAEGICVECGTDLTPDTDSIETSPGEEAACSHAFRESSRTEPTCEEDGVTVSVCTLCGEETTKTEPSPGHRYGENSICSLCGNKKEDSRRNITDLLKNPLFLGALGIVLVQVIFFAVLIARSKRSAHKSRRRAHTYNKD